MPRLLSAAWLPVHMYDSAPPWRFSRVVNDGAVGCRAYARIRATPTPKTAHNPQSVPPWRRTVHVRDTRVAPCPRSRRNARREGPAAPHPSLKFPIHRPACRTRVTTNKSDGQERPAQTAVHHSSYLSHSSCHSNVSDKVSDNASPQPTRPAVPPV